MKNLKVFYNEKQNVTDNASFSPSAGKPAQVLASWKALGLPLDIESPKPCTRSQIALAHSTEYVEGILSGRLLNGFGNRLKSVARSLPWTTGSMVSAALYAVRTGQPAASLTSGYHHACHHSGSGGYCTFNGLMIAAQTLQLKGLTKRVGIVDIDNHFGNGTEDIIDQLNLRKEVRHYTFGAHGINKENAEQWLSALPGIMRGFSDCDVILYQAGADPFVLDDLGGVLTKAQLVMRDRIVFQTAKEMGIGVAWNLAGGYSKPFQHVLDIHNNTAIECLSVYGESLREKLCTIDGERGK